MSEHKGAMVWSLHQDTEGDWRIRDGDGHHLVTVVEEEPARLMAAAPALLAALEGLIPTEHCGWVCAQFKDEIAAAKAAIKQAKGEA